MSQFWTTENAAAHIILILVKEHMQMEMEQMTENKSNTLAQWSPEKFYQI